MRIYAYITLAAIAISCFVFSYHIGRQSVLQKLSDDRVQVVKDGQKVDAAVYAADDDGLVCLLIECQSD